MIKNSDSAPAIRSDLLWGWSIPTAAAGRSPPGRLGQLRRPRAIRCTSVTVTVSAVSGSEMRDEDLVDHWRSITSGVRWAEQRVGQVL